MSRDPHLHFEHKLPEKLAVRGKAKRRKRKAPAKREPKNEPGILWKSFREQAKTTDRPEGGDHSGFENDRIDD